METAIIRLQVICQQPPPDQHDGQPMVFGLQDKKNSLAAGEKQPDGSLRFCCEVVAILQDDEIDFRGSQVHGGRVLRFLYLSWGYASGGWVRRMKIPLSNISWAMVQQVMTEKAMLEATIETSTTSATVRPKRGWQVTSA